MQLELLAVVVERDVARELQPGRAPVHRPPARAPHERPGGRRQPHVGHGWARSTSSFTSAPQPGPAGIDRVEFEVSTNPGAPFGPLTRIASGGELSRFILALKVALAEAGDAATMIFDEIDRGVGGAVASAIGERLARLAQKSQLLVVTHSPQVAARAAHHYRIEKTHEDGVTRTHVRKLTPDERREEIARMLSGAAITDEARAQAARLLEAE